MTDYQKLRQLAQNATPGPWYVTRGGDFQEVRPAPEMSAPTIIWDGAHQDATGEWIDSPDAEFIAAANPTVVLALLDELQEAKARALREAADEIAQRIQSVKPRSLRDEDLDAGGLNVCSELRHMSRRLGPR